MGTRGRTSVSRVAAGAGCALLVSLALAACTPEPSPNPTPSSSTSETPKPSESPAPDPELVPAGDAADNLPYFDLVNEKQIDASGGAPDGRAFIDSLVAAGFDKTRMEVTPDTTSIGGTADSIEFSAQIGGECLIGQLGPAGYASVAAPLLSTGRCLIGQTRAIDW